MIGQLRGKLIEKQPPMLMLDVQGVGYCLSAPLSTFFALPPLQHEVTLRVHHVVREDAQLLFGFLTLAECRLFQEVIKINGIGPKVALAILSALSPMEFIEVVNLKDIKRLQSIPGIGAKTAGRILVEIQDRLTKLPMEMGVHQALSSAMLAHRGNDAALQEAIDALISLGYKSNEAIKAVGKVNKPYTGCEQILKEALQGLAKV